VIKNWEEASGQGDGGMDREQENQGDADEQEDEVLEYENAESSSMSPAAFGSLSQIPARALDSRAAFLGGMLSYILYYWEVIESRQLLSLAMQRLSDHANAADASPAPLVSRRRGGATSVASTISSSGTRRRTNRRRQGSDEQMMMRWQVLMCNYLCSLFKTW
jgi:hypothetical protein